MGKNNLKKKRSISVGSRGSRLALIQVDEAFSLLRKENIRLSFKHLTFSTKGDIDKKTPMANNPLDDFFTDALDRALIQKKIDIAIHSAKDLPKVLNQNLDIFALTVSVDETDAFVGKVNIAQLKKGAKIGTSSSLRKQEILNLNPNISTINLRGTIDERLALVDQGKLDGIIVATCALKRLNLANRIKDILPYETTPLQGQLAVVGRKDDVQLKKIFSAIDARIYYGKIMLVGAGPGDPELITMKAVKCLEKADCVFYDYLIDQRLLDYAKKAERIYVGKRKGDKTLSQSALSRMLRKKAMQGKNVVRLKGGDPLIFGRGADEIIYLKSYHIDVEVVPGVSSATGIPATLGIPLTARGVSSSVAFISGHGEGETHHHPKPVTIPKVDTIVFLMGLTKLSAIVSSLRRQGWNDTTPMIVISKGTRSDEKIVCGTIQNIETLVKKAKLDPPALMIVGETVKFWDGRKTASDTILYLGTNPEKYQNLGKIVHLPMIHISPLTYSANIIKKLMQDLKEYEIIILTSRFAVRHFFDILKKEKYSAAKLKKFDFAVIGQDTTGELAKFKIKPKIQAVNETSEGLLEVLAKHGSLKGKNILFPRSSLPNPYLKEELITRGAKVKELTVYKNIKPDKRNVSFEGIQKILFTSPSTVKNFLKDYKTIPSHWQILSKGPHTQKALKEAGYQSEVFVEDKIS